MNDPVCNGELSWLKVTYQIPYFKCLLIRQLANERSQSLFHLTIGLEIAFHDTYEPFFYKVDHLFIFTSYECFMIPLAAIATQASMHKIIKCILVWKKETFLPTSTLRCNPLEQNKCHLKITTKKRLLSTRIVLCPLHSHWLIWGFWNGTYICF